MPNIILIMGLPGSGKQTTFEKLVNYFGYIPLSISTIYQKMRLINPYSEIEQIIGRLIFRNQLTDLIKDDNDIIAKSNLSTYIRRRIFYDIVQTHNYQATIVHCYCSYYTNIQRIQSRPKDPKDQKVFDLNTFFKKYNEYEPLETDIEIVSARVGLVKYDTENLEALCVKGISFSKEIANFLNDD